MVSLDEVKAAIGPLPETGLPIAFLPVQVQTRFVTRGGAPQLLVRVYPDELHLDSHPAALTEAEVLWGQAYWELIWPAAGDQDARRRAWEQLATRFGARRAAWVSRALTPVNLNQRPGTPPVFPDPGPLRAETTFQRVHATLLPDRWVVMGFKGADRVLLALGAPIPDGLPVSPDPEATEEPSTAGDDELPIDDGMVWMVDFEKAEQVGMGIRVAPPPSELDTLLVFGVRTTLAPEAGAEKFEALLDGHHYTRGLAFVPPGTPTNNTEEEPAGYRRGEPDPSASFRVEVDPPPLGSDSDAALTATLVGLRPELFASVAGADLAEDRASLQMQTALWPVTGGYYLEHLLGGPPGEPGEFSVAQLAEARRFFLDFVRHQGPLPTLRIGHQPYGLLPVMVLPEGKGPFERALTALREVWRSALPQATRLSAGTQDDENLVEILRMQPVSVGYRARLAFERGFFTVNGLAGAMDPQLEEHTRLLLERLTQLWESDIWANRRVLHTIPTEAAKLIDLPLIQAEEGPRSYLTFLRSATFDDILNEHLPVDPPAVLLYKLLRHSVLLAQATTVASILGRRDPEVEPVREETLVDVVGGNLPIATGTLLRIMDLDPDLRARIHDLRAAEEPEAIVLEQLRTSLDGLALLPADSLGRQLSGNLDLFAYRLDAWITALATRRLHELRKIRPRALVLGGFGWVQRLTPAPRPPVTELPPGEPGPLFAATERGGFLHAPSMSHAAAAAVLRSGHLADTGENGAQPFAIDMRSSRVRLAQWLLDGVREGRQLEELLGYRLERDIHDRGLDRFIPGLRRMSRLASIYQSLGHHERQRRLSALRQRYGWPASTTQSDMERLTEAMVTDGLELARLRQANALPFELAGFEPEARNLLEPRLQELLDAVDAVSDALTAEGVYQIVRGNPERAAASVDSVAHGDIQPPELHFARTPRPGSAQTHRLVVLLSGPVVTQPNPTPRQVRSASEPALDGWLRQLLGPLDRVRFRAEFVVGDETIEFPGELRLSRLLMSHLDLLYLSGADLDRLLEFDLRFAAPTSVPADAPVRLLGARPAGLAADLLSLNEFLELLRAFRETILPSRAVHGRDLAPADTGTPPGLDPAELRTRTDRAAAALALVRQRLDDAVRAVGDNPGQLDVLRERLVDLVFLGCPDAVPVSARGTEQREQLLAQAAAGLAEVDRRIAAESGLRSGFDRSAADPEQQVRHDQDRLRAIFGPAFLALPVFRPVNAGDLATALQNSDKLQGGDPLQAFSWLQSASRVRAGASRLTRALTCAAALDRPGALELRVGQLPFQNGDRWIALPDPPPGGYPAGKLSLVAHLPLAFKADAPMSGLMIDEWVDVVPASEITTGVAFHSESPGARPPQSVLLAVTPAGNPNWTVETIERTLLETLELAQLRALDPQALADDVLVHRALPASYLSVNLARDTLSTDLS